jgi:hypothetical protein
MDPVRETQNNQTDALDFHDPDWVEKAWIREDALGICQYAVWERRDHDGVESFEMHRPDNRCDPADSALGILPEEEGIEVASEKRGNLEYTSSFRLCC